MTTGARPWFEALLLSSYFPPTMITLLPIAAVGYSMLYLLFGGGLGGAVLIFIVAKLLGR